VLLIGLQIYVRIRPKKKDVGATPKLLESGVSE
jgi:hypothetical protein